MADEVELIGGIEQREIVLVEYSARWPMRFWKERNKIEAVMGNVDRRVVHVGSTAVKGMIAKPIIDVQLSVPDVAHEVSYSPALEAAGYVLRVREPHHRMARTPNLDVHVHICSIGSEWERRHVLFRDWLRVSDGDRRRYAEVKTTLASKDWPSMNHYAEAKSSVIEEITVRAEEWATEVDWSLAHASAD